MKADFGWVCAGFEPPGWYSTSTPFILLPGTFGRARSKTNVTVDFSVVISTVDTSSADAALTEGAAKATPHRNLVNIWVLLRGDKFVDTNPPSDALTPTALIADRQAYASDKQRQVNAHFPAGPAPCFIWAAPLPRSL